MVQQGKCFPDQLKYLSDTDESLAKNKSNFYPPRNRNITLDNYIIIIIIIIMTIFNEETFSLKSGLQKGPRKLKIKNLQ